MENKKRKIVVISIAVCVILLCGSIVACNNSKKDKTTDVNVNNTEIEETETETEGVDVTEVKATESEEPTETQTATVDVISEEDTQAKVNDGGSVTTSNNDSKGTTNSSNNNSCKSTTTTPVTEKPKAHEHSWQPIYKTVHHDAVTHTEQQDQGHNETTSQWVYVMSDGTEFTDKDSARAYQTADGHEDLTVGVVSRETTTWIPNVVTVTVIDTAAYDEQVIDHYECSCGATK